MAATAAVLGNQAALSSSFKQLPALNSILVARERESESAHFLAERRRRKAKARGEQVSRKKGGNRSIFDFGAIGAPFWGGRHFSLFLPFLLPSSRPYRGMSTPAASQAAMTLEPFGMVTVFPLTVHSIPSAAGAGAGVDASERARKKSVPAFSLLLLLPPAPQRLLLPLVLAAAPPSARAAARRAAARAARSMSGEFERG